MAIFNPQDIGAELSRMLLDPSCYDPQKLREKLRQMLRQLSYKEGIFKLTSGRESDFYVDGKLTALDPVGSWLIGNCFCNIISTVCPDVKGVAGVTLGADPLVTATSIVGLHRSLFLPQIIVRKEPKNHGTENQLEEAATVPKNSALVLLDDVLTTGGTLYRIGIKALEKAGYTIAAILTILDREEGGREFLAEKGYSNLHSIFTRTELLA